MRILIAILLLLWGCVASAADNMPIVPPPVCRTQTQTVPLCAIPYGWVPVCQWWERDCHGNWRLMTRWEPPCRVFVIVW